MGVEPAMPPAVCGIVGSAGSGKTELAQLLVPLLTERGLRIGYIKHAAHGFDIDRPGSDSARVRDVGTPEVLLAGPDGSVHMSSPPSGPSPLASLVRRLRRSDVILVEGFSGELHPKIRVRAAGTPPREVAPPVVLELERPAAGWLESDLAAATDAVLEVVGEVLPPAVSVTADGVAIPVSGFAAEIVASGVSGLVSTLRGVVAPAEVTVTIRRGSGRVGPKDGASDGGRV